MYRLHEKLLPLHARFSKNKKGDTVIDDLREMSPEELQNASFWPVPVKSQGFFEAVLDLTVFAVSSLMSFFQGIAAIANFFLELEKNTRKNVKQAKKMNAFWQGKKRKGKLRIDNWEVQFKRRKQASFW